MIPGTFPTGKSGFGAPNCPVRALRYYHRYLTEHPELRKDRRLFVPIEDNNAGKELSASTISRWICTTIVDSHAAIQNSRNLSGSVKAHEVRAVATSLQLFNKVDLHSVMKAGRWSSGCTFTSFYLRDLYPQADSLQRAGPIVAAGTSSGSPPPSQVRISLCILFRLFFSGNLVVPFLPPKGRGPEVPKVTLVRQSFYLWESHCVCRLGARTDRLPSLLCRILA